MLFNFLLTPLKDVQPWGKPDRLSLSWFGLTDGEYWIAAGEGVLFEYSEHARNGGAHRYCDYQVARLYEDVIDMLPTVLEPIPTELTQYMSGDTAVTWNQRFSSWCDRSIDMLDEDRYWKLIDAARTWSSQRYLDSLYLRPSSSINIWSDTEYVHFEWDNRDKFFEGKPAWTATRGHFQLSRTAYLQEVRSFHDRLMHQMSERVRQVLDGALSSHIHVDIPGLVKEHEQRCMMLDTALRNPQPTNWNEVTAAIHEILSNS
jgi:hypothetical protein